MTTIVATITVEIFNAEMLHNYTSGFMPDSASPGQRVTAILAHGGHPIHPDINGIGVVDTSHEVQP